MLGKCIFFASKEFCPTAIFPASVVASRSLAVALLHTPAMLSPRALVTFVAALAALAAAQAPACTASSYSSIYTPCTLSTTTPYRNITNLVYFQIQNWWGCLVVIYVWLTMHLQHGRCSAARQPVGHQLHMPARQCSVGIDRPSPCTCLDEIGLIGTAVRSMARVRLASPARLTQAASTTTSSTGSRGTTR